MKLGFISTEYFRKQPGMAESDRELCRELCRQGTEVRALVEDRTIPPGGVVVDRDGPVCVWRYQAPRFHALRAAAYADKLLKAVTGAPRLASCLALYRRFAQANQDLDLLQVESPFPEGMLAGLAVRRRRIPFVVSARGWEALEFPLLRAWGIRWALGRAVGVRPNAPNMAEILIHRFGVAPDRLRVIPTNLSGSAYRPKGTEPAAFRESSRAWVRERWGLTHDSLLVAAARFVPSKGLEDLLDALALLQASGADVGLLVCGEGMLRERLRAKAKALSLAGTVFPGALPHAEMPRVLAGADLLVIPSRLDWTPRVVVEAAAVGTPALLTTAVGCAAWSLEAGAGRAVPPASPEALAAGVRAWLEDRGARAEAGRRAETWAEGFRVGAVAEAMRRFHEDLLQPRAVA